MFDQAIEILKSHRPDLPAFSALDDNEEISPELIRDRNAINDAIAFLENAQIGGFGALVSLVRQWGVDKGLTGPTGKATAHGQLDKLIEEFCELRDAVEKKDQHEIVDAVGDMTVVLILLSELSGFRFETALRAAYDEIKNRTGHMGENGQFIKDQTK